MTSEEPRKITVEVCVFVTMHQQQEQSLLQHLAAGFLAALSIPGWARHFFVVVVVVYSRASVDCM